MAPSSLLANGANTAAGGCRTEPPALGLAEGTHAIGACEPGHAPDTLLMRPQSVSTYASTRTPMATALALTPEIFDTNEGAKWVFASSGPRSSTTWRSVETPFLLPGALAGDLDGTW